VLVTETAALPETTDWEFSVISGPMLPIWNKIPGDNVRIYRMMTDDGAQFSEQLYDRYLTVFDEAFADEPEYSVPGDASAYSRIEPVIDLLWSEWSAKRVPGS